ncbi:DUF2280 domain-containing protein [Burkholderia pyrrocinia]|uniref:DUF2280 domain-containing protein n=1 Tax=Burkholderia pyrrocinia TaxID=60550 RepID=UPI001588DF15|nr:DUF2280 domain-containing protein [Burkholderia pyrrocinia]
MATLTDDVKAFVVRALACFDTPTQVASAVKEEFGISIERMQVAAYDPTKFAGRKLSAKWRALFDATRTAFLEDQASIPIANLNFRLRALERMYKHASARGNMQLAARVLEQAAKESGGVFTNRQRLEHTGKNGAPIATTGIPVNLDDLTDDELALLERIATRRRGSH